jgi:glycosyltransferase involved in cell wall biosynthesis
MIGANGTPLISVICPVFNEEAAIPTFYTRISQVLARYRGRYEFEILFTNNASTDTTYQVLMALRAQDTSVQVITFSRNFGYQASLTAGLHHASGDAIVVIDVDCEDPPELLPRLIEGWEQGCDIVYGIREKRPESFALQCARKAFYRITHMIADYDFVIDMAEFSMFSRRVRDALLRSRSTFPFIRAEIGFVGFKRLGIPYTRERRMNGSTHYNVWRMFLFAVGGMLSSSTFFLRLACYTGFPLAALNLAVAVALLCTDVWRLVGALALVDFCFMIVFLAFIAAYIARIYKDASQRPLYVLDSNYTHLNSDVAKERGSQS